MPERASGPGAVNKFRKVLAGADGMVIASPEYNYSIPGGLKMLFIGHQGEKIPHLLENMFP